VDQIHYTNDGRIEDAEAVSGSGSEIDPGKTAARLLVHEGFIGP
jgi:hypothetical protein